MRRSSPARQNWLPEDPRVLDLLRHGTIDGCDLLQAGSNYVFIVQLNAGEAGTGLAVYKPLRGEAPLWDYPTGNLYKHEVATYLVGEALGWRFVPPTVVRDGPYGVGSAQLFIEHDPRANFFTVRDVRPDAFRQMALFDALINNGDRKGGHCLLGANERIWGIDHGLSFHPENKLRTVIWDYAGEPIPADLVEDLRRFQRGLAQDEQLAASLRELLTRQEMAALGQRLNKLIADPRLPKSGYRRPVPWPPV